MKGHTAKFVDQLCISSRYEQNTVYFLYGYKFLFFKTLASLARIKNILCIPN